jgi:hypothetical protein
MGNLKARSLKVENLKAKSLKVGNLKVAISLF